MRNHPRGSRLGVVALVYLAGNLALHQLPELPGGAWWVPASVALVCCLGHVRTRYLAWFLLAFCWAGYVGNSRLDTRLQAELAGRDVRVTGWVDEFPTPSAERTVFSLRVESAEMHASPERLRLSWYEPPIEVRPAMQLALTVRLRPPRGLANPGGFDYERWLLLENYGATGYVRAAEVLDGPRRWPAAWLQTRYSIAEQIAGAGLSADATALLTALVVGERYQFGNRHWESLRRTGTSHLVAISGMHIGLIATLCFWGVRKCCLRLPGALAYYDLEIAAAVSASAAFGYAALAGFALPTQRALLMLLVALYVVVRRRQITHFDGLAVALLAVLTFDPFASLTGSFWMSFGAVALLLALTAVRRRNSSGPISSFCRLQTALTMGLVPLVVLYFGAVSIAAPLVNLLAVPLFGFCVVPLSLLGTALMPLDDGALLRLVGIVADVFWMGLHGVSVQSWSARVLPQPTSLVALLAFTAVCLGLPWHVLPGRRLAWFGLLPLLVAAREPPATGALASTVIDVGHGLAVLVETAQHRLLYDAGPLYRSGFDAGGEIVVPLLQRRPKPGLDMLIIGHADADHAGGARAVLGAFPTASVLHGPDVTGFDGAACQAGMRWEWDGVSFAVLHPADDFPVLGNESSCVLKVSTGQHVLLITGDIERYAEARLSGTAALDADVVVVPHHGSATSSSQSFVASTSASVAIVSAAHGNQWGFPRPEVSQRWRSEGARVLVTGEVGAVQVHLGAGSIRVRAERQRRRRYWHAESRTISGESFGSAL